MGGNGDDMETSICLIDFIQTQESDYQKLDEQKITAQTLGYLIPETSWVIYEIYLLSQSLVSLSPRPLTFSSDGSSRVLMDIIIEFDFIEI